MNRLQIRPEVRQDVEAAFGKPVPEPSSPEFVAYLKELTQARPELARKLKDGLVLSSPAVPAALQNQVRQGQARERQRGLVRSLFQRRGWQGDWVPDKRKLLLFGLAGALAGLAALLFTLNRPTLQARTPSAVSAVGSSLNRPESPPVAPAPPEVPSSGITPPTPTSIAPQTVAPPTAPRTIAPPPTIAPVAPSPPLPAAPAPTFGYGTAGGPTSALPAATPGAANPPRQPPVIFTRKAEDAPSSLVQPSSQPAAAPTGVTPSASTPTQQRQPPVVFTRKVEGNSGGGAQQQSTGSAGSPEPAPSTVFVRPSAALEGAAPQPQAQEAPRAPMLIYQSKPQAQGNGSSLMFSRSAQNTPPQPQASAPSSEAPAAQTAMGVYTAPPQQPTPNTLFQREPAAGQASSPPPPSSANQGSGLTTLYQRPQTTPTQNPPATSALPTLPPPTPPGTTAPSAPPAVTPGQQIPAKLATAVAALEGGQVPVVAESEGAVWIGSASLDAAKRVQVAFDRVVKDGQVTETQAIALNPQGVPGLEALLEEQTPSLASDILRAGLNGVSAYVQGLAGASSSTVLPGGGAVQSKEAPPLGVTLLGEIGKLFALPQGQASVVRLARVDKGTQILILVGVGDRPGGRP